MKKGTSGLERSECFSVCLIFFCFSCIERFVVDGIMGWFWQCYVVHTDEERGGRKYLISTLDLMRVIRYNMKSSMLRKLERYCSCI